MRFRTWALALIPGTAQVDLGRPARGLVFFALFAFCLNGVFVAPLILGSREARVACAVGAAGVWIAALYDAMRLAGASRKKELPEAPAPAGKKVEKPVS